MTESIQFGGFSLPQIIIMSKCIIVAEMSANHGGDKTIAIETIRAAKRAGADAVKMQTYTADTRL